MRLDFRLFPNEFRTLKLLLSGLGQILPTDLASVASQWGQCPTLWGWLVASHPKLKLEPVEEWLAKSPQALAEEITRTLKTSQHTSQQVPEWLTIKTGSPVANRDEARGLPNALTWLWERSEAEISDRAVASVILLLSNARVPLVTSTQAGQRSFPPNWYGRPVCQWIRDFRQQNASCPQVNLALTAQEASASMSTRTKRSTKPEVVTNQLAKLFSKHVQQEALFEQEKLASLKQLAYGASHEVNNPLANISTRAQTLLQDETDPERRQKLAAIVSQAFRAHDMISNMMLFAHPPEIQRERLELGSWLKERFSDLQELASSQGTQLQLSSGLEDLADQIVEGDSQQLGILLQGLVRNACEALGEGGTIQVSASISDQDPTCRRWILTVSDNGPGMTAENRRHCFDPFYSGREAGRGLGFGLSKAWAITKLHGGSIEVFENEPQGLAFQVTLPNGMIEAQDVESSSEEVPCKTTPTAG